MTSQRVCQLYQGEVMPYITAWAWQQKLVEYRRHHPEAEDVLLLLEHPPVYTLGQGGSLEFLKFDPHDPRIEVHRTERGGEVTYHCPGQLVGYPILNLRHHCQDLHWYLRQLEEVIIHTLWFYGLKGKRIEGLTGVWLGDRKVAAIGIKASRWITMHGFAVNVCPDLAGFSKIIPCGIEDRPVGSLAQFIPDIRLDDVRNRLIQAFAKVFGVRFVERSVIPGDF